MRFRELSHRQYQTLAQTWAASSPFDPYALKPFLAWSQDEYAKLPTWRINIFRAVSAQQMADVYAARREARRAARREGQLFYLNV